MHTLLTIGAIGTVRAIAFAEPAFATDLPGRQVLASRFENDPGKVSLAGLSIGGAAAPP